MAARSKPRAASPRRCPSCTTRSGSPQATRCSPASTWTSPTRSALHRDAPALPEDRRWHARGAGGIELGKPMNRHSIALLLTALAIVSFSLLTVLPDWRAGEWLALAAGVA